MATEILIKNNTTVVWANTGDYNPGAGVIYTRTAQIDLTSIADAAARQGAKVDLGATRASAYVVRFSPAITSMSLVLSSPVTGAIRQTVFMFLLACNSDFPISRLYLERSLESFTRRMSPITS